MAAARVGAASLLVLAAILCAAPADGASPCPEKSGEVFSIGLMSPIAEFALSALLAVEEVNADVFAEMPTIGCFPFNLTLFRGGSPADEVCQDDPDYPFGNIGSFASTECDPSEVCFPRNMIWEDTACTASLGAPAAEAMLADGVTAVIGPHCSEVARSVHDTLLAGSVPYVSWATSSALSDETVYPYHFRTVGPDGAQARAMVDIALQLNASSASIISDPSEFSQSFADDLIGYLARTGLELRTHQVLQIEEDPGRQTVTEASPADISADVAALAEAGADVTFSVFRPRIAPPTKCVNGRAILQASADQGYETTWINGDLLFMEECVPDGFDGTVLATRFSEGYGPVAGRLSRLWELLAQESCKITELNVFDAAIFDGVLAIAIAIRAILETGGRVDGDAIVEQWSDPGFGFLGSSGNVRFGADDSVRYYTYGSNDRATLYDILSYSNGSFSPIGSWDPLSSSEEGVVSFSVPP